MTIKNLIEKLKEYPEDMPIAVNGCIDFTNVNCDNIKINKRVFHCFPFTENDKFEYINLEMDEEEYWGA